MAQITIISHWCKLIESLQTSPLGFYTLVDQAIKRRQVPDAETRRVEYHESGLFAAKREYLRVQRKTLAYDICGAPFGTGFFVSSWFGKELPKGGVLLLLGIFIASFLIYPLFKVIFGTLLGFIFWIAGIPCLLLLLGFMISEEIIGGEDTVLGIPVLGFLYEKIFHPFSYYKLDQIQMYQAAIHAAIMEAVDEITKANGLRALSEEERKPIMKDFLGK